MSGSSMRIVSARLSRGWSASMPTTRLRSRCGDGSHGDAERAGLQTVWSGVRLLVSGNFPPRMDSPVRGRVWHPKRGTSGCLLAVQGQGWYRGLGPTVMVLLPPPQRVLSSQRWCP